MELTLPQKHVKRHFDMLLIWLEQHFHQSGDWQRLNMKLSQETLNNDSHKLTLSVTFDEQPIIIHALIERESDHGIRLQTFKNGESPPAESYGSHKLNPVNENTDLFYDCAGSLKNLLSDINPLMFNDSIYSGPLVFPVAGMPRTDQQIVEQTNEIARIIYAFMGYNVPQGTEFHTETINRHPQERQCWQAACEIQRLMTQTDPEDALAELED